MASIIKRHIFKDGKVMHDDRIAYANGEFISLDDFDTEIQSRNNKIAQLKCELDKTYNQLMEVEKDAQEQIEELEKTRSDWVDNAVAWKEKYEESEKNIKELETDRLVKLPFDALETANMILNATYKRKNCMTGIEYDKDIYSIGDLEQIAEHLLVYCKHNKNSEE